MNPGLYRKLGANRREIRETYSFCTWRIDANRNLGIQLKQIYFLISVYIIDVNFDSLGIRELITLVKEVITTKVKEIYQISISVDKFSE